MLENNHVGIKGTDILLQIDALDNCGDCEPGSERHRPNTFIKPYGGLFFDICLINRSGSYDNDKVPARGNFWSITPNEEFVPPLFLFKEYCDENQPDNLSLAYEPIVTQTPRGCKPFAEPTDPEIPQDDPCEMTVATPNGPSADLPVAVQQKYQQGRFELYAEDFATAKEKWTPTAHIAEEDRTDAEDKCRTKIDFARTYVPRGQVYNPYTAPFSDGAAPAFDPVGLHLSPNPTEDVFTLRGAQGVYTFSVFDTFGKVVAAGDFTAEVSIDLSEVSPGVYFVSVQNRATAESETLRVVKQ